LKSLENRHRIVSSIRPPPKGKPPGGTTAPEAEVDAVHRYANSAPAFRANNLNSEESGPLLRIAGATDSPVCSFPVSEETSPARQGLPAAAITRRFQPDCPGNPKVPKVTGKEVLSNRVSATSFNESLRRGNRILKLP
jgi:hypothetical protein